MLNLKTLLLAFALLFLVSCDDDDDDNDDTNISTEVTVNVTNLSHSWTLESAKLDNQESQILDLLTPKGILFNSDFTCVIDTYSGTWSLNESNKSVSYGYSVELEDGTIETLEAIDQSVYSLTDSSLHFRDTFENSVADIIYNKISN
ncbi:hypothetical protein OAQ99_01210 [Candidatus Kapabacteria bacterium]|nr:hypothetical protein [Candidatus Kapabacteria bacterium]